MAVEVLRQADTAAVWQEYVRTRDIGLRNTIVVQNMGLVYSIANHYAPLVGEGIDDLIQEGCLGLIRAVERFRPDYGTQFSTYAYPVISGAIRNYLRFRRRLQGKLHQRPAPESAQDTAGQSRPPPVAGEELLAPDELEALAGAVREDLADQTVARVLMSGLLERLSDMERRIVTHFFYDDLTQREIAHLLARSDSRVSRLLRRALERIRLLLANVQQEEERVTSPTQARGRLAPGFVVDIETGLFSAEHLQRSLAREIQLARDLGAPLTLALLRPDAAARELTPRALSQLARSIYRSVRVLDHVFRAGPQELGLIFSLPPNETMTICARFQGAQKSMDLEFAVSSFPHDADSPHHLLEAARGRLPHPGSLPAQVAAQPALPSLP